MTMSPGALRPRVPLEASRVGPPHPYAPLMYPDLATLSECDPFGSARNANRPSLVVIAGREPASVTICAAHPFASSRVDDLTDDDCGAARERRGTGGKLRRGGGRQNQDGGQGSQGFAQDATYSSWVVWSRAA